MVLHQNKADNPSWCKLSERATIVANKATMCIFITKQRTPIKIMFTTQEMMMMIIQLHLKAMCKWIVKLVPSIHMIFIGQHLTHMR